MKISLPNKVEDLENPPSVTVRPHPIKGKIGNWGPISVQFKKYFRTKHYAQQQSFSNTLSENWFPAIFWTFIKFNRDRLKMWNKYKQN